MNILLFTPLLPWPPHDGMRIRISETLRYLSRKHRLTLLTSVSHDRELENLGALSQVCERIVTTTRTHEIWRVLPRLARGLLHRIPLFPSQYYERNLARQLHHLSSSENFDIIHIESTALAPYLTDISAHSRAKKILATHNIDSIKFQREKQFASWDRRGLGVMVDNLYFESWEKRVICQFDGVTVVSNLEKTWIESNAPQTPVELVPNGVDTRFFHPMPSLRPEQSIVFTGLMDYPPNIDAVVWFSDHILPALQAQVPGIRFKIVGSRPHPKVVELGNRSGIEVTGEVPDIRPYLAEASALVVPLRSGAGTRLKILQALAMERPVISTSVGAEGLDVTPGGNILIADTVDQFVHHVRGLPETSARLGKAAGELVRNKYDWQICLGGFENLYQRLTCTSTS
jgi:polysaccharide biosynthesis protein PslH